MKDIKLIAAIALVIVVALFVLQNAEPVGVDLLFWTWSASRALVLLFVFLIGVAVGYLWRASIRRRR